jgi:formylglycine-generating enzyme required for sulfatase activity
LAAGPAKDWHEPQTQMAFVSLPKACFSMGAKARAPLPSNDLIRWVGFSGDITFDEHPPHEVCVSAFWLGQYEVRADEWERVMGVPPPQGKGREPAAGVTWQAATQFAEKLSAMTEGKSIFRLPTEAEWEYACRAGKAQFELAQGRRLVDYAVFSYFGNPEEHHPQPLSAGSRLANAWGLFDMLGNVWEWVADDYASDAYAQHALFDPLHRVGAGDRVLRGGSHRTEERQLGCGRRSFYPLDQSMSHVGFRLVRQPRP